MLGNLSSQHFVPVLPSWHKKNECFGVNVLLCIEDAVPHTSGCDIKDCAVTAWDEGAHEKCPNEQPQITVR